MRRPIILFASLSKIRHDDALIAKLNFVRSQRLFCRSPFFFYPFASNRGCHDGPIVRLKPRYSIF